MKKCGENLVGNPRRKIVSSKISTRQPRNTHCTPAPVLSWSIQTPVSLYPFCIAFRNSRHRHHGDPGSAVHPAVSAGAGYCFRSSLSFRRIAAVCSFCATGDAESQGPRPGAAACSDCIQPVQLVQHAQAPSAAADSPTVHEPAARPPAHNVGIERRAELRPSCPCGRHVHGIPAPVCLSAAKWVFSHAWHCTLPASP